MELDDVFDEQQKPPAEVANQEGEAEQQEAEKAPAAEQGAPPAPDTTDKHVPLAALEAERKGRQDWKEKSIRGEEELKLLREQVRRLQSQPQPQPQPQQPLSELQQLQQEQINLKLDISELMARQQYGDETVDSCWSLFQAAAAQNPALFALVNKSKHPWDVVVKEAKRIELSQQIGTNPVAYREQMRQEILAELNQTPAKPPAPLPQSLATARSSASRSAGGFTGPPPLSTLFEN